MRNLYLALLALACACSSTDDMTTGSGSGSMSGSSTTAGSASDGSSGAEGSGTGSESGGAPTTGTPAECSGTYHCFGADAADCEDDMCCVAVHGRRYEQSDGAWCLGAEDVYVGCAHKYYSVPCDHTGTLQCIDTDEQEYFAEIDAGCFPHFCSVGTAPDTNGAVCGE